MHLRPGAERAHRGSRLRHALHPRRARRRSASATAGASSTTTARTTAPRARRVRASAPTPTSSSTSPAAPGSGATSTRASRARSSSTPIRCSRSSRSPRATPGTWTSSAASITCSPSAPTSARRPRDVPTGGFTWHKTWQPVVTGLWRPRRPPRGDRFTTVMTWKIESFTDVDGNKDREFVKFIDLPTRDAAAVRAGRQRPAALLREHGWPTVDAMSVSRSLVGLPRLHPGLEGRVRRRQARLRRAPVGLVQRPHRVLPGGRPAGARPGHRVERAPAGTATGCSVLDAEEALDGLARIDGDYDAPRARAPPRLPRDHFDAARVLPPSARDGRPMSRRAPHRPRRARRHVGPAAAIRVHRDADGAPDRRARGARPRRDAVCHRRIVATRATLHADVRARLPRGRRRCGRGSCASCSTWPPRSSGPRRSTSSTARRSTPRCRCLRAPLGSAARAHAAPRARPPTRWRCGRATPTRRSSRSPTRSARAVSGLNVAGVGAPRRGHGGVPVPRRSRDDYLLFLGRFTEGKGVLQAIDVARRAGLRLVLAAEDNDYYREKVAPLVDGQQVVYAGEVAARRQGGAARRRAGAALSGAGRRTVRPGARRGDACGTPVAALRSRRREGDRRGRRHRRRVRLARRAGGRAAARAGARPRPRAGGGGASASASTAWWRAMPTSMRALAGARCRLRERRVDERRGSRPRGPLAARGLRPPRRRVAGGGGLLACCAARGARRVAPVPDARRGLDAAPRARPRRQPGRDSRARELRGRRRACWASPT